MQRILLADDEPDLLWAVGHSLRHDGYDVVTAGDGIEALMNAGRQRPDVVVLDITMPQLDGWQVCRSLRRDPDLAGVPILFLSGSDDVEARIRGFEEGADDYIVKPFDVRELKARIRALLRRQAALLPAPQQGQVLTCGDLVLDLQTCAVRSGTREARLTPAELDLLRYLIERPNQVFSSQHLLEHVWGYPPDTAEQGLVRWHVMNLRTKIEADPAHPLYLRTVPRHGYMLAVQLQPRVA